MLPSDGGSAPNAAAAQRNGEDEESHPAAGPGTDT
jgi:hypothetical protein